MGGLYLILNVKLLEVKTGICKNEYYLYMLNFFSSKLYIIIISTIWYMYPNSIEVYCSIMEDVKELFLYHKNYSLHVEVCDDLSPL